MYDFFGGVTPILMPSMNIYDSIVKNVRKTDITAKHL